MTPALDLAAGLLVSCGGWLGTRTGRAGFGWHRWLLLDAALPWTVFAMVLLTAGRPVFAGTLTAGLCAGFAFADRAKRRTLREPIVYTDVFQTLDIVRHPRLAAPFPNRLPILVAVVLALGACRVLFSLERPVLPVPAFIPLAAFIVTLILLCGLAAGPLNAAIARSLRRAGLSGEPFEDAARFGMLGALLAYGLVARGERHGRQRALPSEIDRQDLKAPTARPAPTAAMTPAAPATAGSAGPAPLRKRAAPPVILAQCESFFDARRLGAGVVPGLLPAYDRLCAGSLQWGRLGVPCWGANTVRSEFAVLTGLDDAALGLDRFNPYHRFARRPVASVASRLRKRGYRTVCIHPFDRRFYRRDLVMPQLGFDDFIGAEAFTGAERINGFVADSAIADAVDALWLEQHGQPVFVFAITLENHGPWPVPAPDTGHPLAPGLALPAGEAAVLERYLASLRNGDALLARLAGSGDDGRIVGFYGDHQPSLSAASMHDGDDTSDYVLWRAGVNGAGPRIDLPAQALGAALLEALAALPAEDRSP